MIKFRQIINSIRHINLDRKVRISLPALIGVLGVTVLGGLFLGFDGFGLLNSDSEIEEIRTAVNIDERVRLYRKLLERVGPEKAQEELFKSGLPFTGQTHLLNHTTGDYIYDKYGAEGLPKCREYFLGSCFHGFILRAIANGGMDEINRVKESCAKAGPAMFTQCSHAIGHGFLVHVGYKKLTDALKMCDEMLKTDDSFPGFSCYDGVFMENIWGVHSGQPSPDRWVRESDLSYPCNDKRIGKKYQLGCWSNQPALMYQLTRGDIEKVGKLCAQVQDPANRNMCFNGLSRQIHPTTAGNIDAVFEKCGLLPKERINYCVVTNALAYFGVGDRSVPFSICNRIGSGSKNECYQGLLASMASYHETNKKLCEQIDDKVWRDRCLSK